MNAVTLDPLASPLRRPRVARALTWTLAVLLLCAGAVICAVVGGLGSAAARVFVNALAVSSAMALLPLTILWFLDRRERESPWAFAAAFLWGGLIATSLALRVNTAALYAVTQWLERFPELGELLGPDAALMIGAPISAPIVEETTKGIGIVLLFLLLRGEFDNVRDGLIYGALVGAGFNWFESALYVQQNFVEYGTAPYGFQIGTRYAWLGLAGHALFSGLFGASLGVARATSKLWLPFVAPPAGFLLAIVGHAWNNSLPLFFALAAAKAGEAAPTEALVPPSMGLWEAMQAASVSNLVLFLPFAILLGVVLYCSGRGERRVIVAELEDEVGRSVTPAEYEAIRADRLLRTRRIDPRAPRVSAAIVGAQNELAFRKRRLRDRGFDPSLDAVLEQRRMQIAALRKRQSPIRPAARSENAQQQFRIPVRSAGDSDGLVHLEASGGHMPTTRRILVPVAAAAVIACLGVDVQAADVVFAATLDGAQNQPEPIKTPATGAVELRLSADGKTVAYKITVDKLANASAADVHLGQSTQNGPSIVKLWTHAPKQGDFTGVLAEGTFGADDLTGPMTGAPLADLVDELKAGNVYVNVHTNDGVDPPNSGPGDYRLGEIRGQLQK
jgi:RsiW-degrading membrane proteinase PrsW (M82 family)